MFFAGWIIDAGETRRRPHTQNSYNGRLKCNFSCCAGAKVTEETSWLAALVMNVVFLLGLFTFAVVLGIISEEIKTQVPFGT